MMMNTTGNKQYFMNRYLRIFAFFCQSMLLLTALTSCLSSKKDDTEKCERSFSIQERLAQSAISLDSIDSVIVTLTDINDKTRSYNPIEWSRSQSSVIPTTFDYDCRFGNDYEILLKTFKKGEIVQAQPIQVQAGKLQRDLEPLTVLYARPEIPEFNDTLYSEGAEIKYSTDLNSSLYQVEWYFNATKRYEGVELRIPAASMQDSGLVQIKVINKADPEIVTLSTIFEIKVLRKLPAKFRLVVQFDESLAKAYTFPNKTSINSGVEIIVDSTGGLSIGIQKIPGTKAVFPDKISGMILKNEGDSLLQISNIVNNGLVKIELSRQKYRVDIVSADTLKGTVSPIVHQDYNFGDMVSVQANPKTGHIFDSWSDGGSGLTRTFIIKSIIDVKAQFKLRDGLQITANASPNGSGKVTVQKGTGAIKFGDKLTLTAVPESGWEFSNWGFTGPNPLDLLVKGDSNLTANFARKKYSVSVQSSDPLKGSVDPEINREMQHGDSLQVEASAAKGFVFDKWSDGIVQPKRLLKITGSLTLKALFKLKDGFQLITKVNPINAGTVNVFRDSGSIRYGDTVSLTAIPGIGYDFSSWGLSNSNPLKITIFQDTGFTAQFIKKSYEVQISSVTGGTVEPVPGKYSKEHGEQLRLKALPNTGFEFLGWSGEVNTKALDTVITVEKPMILKPNFGKIGNYTVSIDVSPSAAGTIKKNPDASNYSFQQTVSVSAIPDGTKGWMFSKWSGDLTGTSSSQNISIAGHVLATAEFEKMPIAITLSTSPAGLSPAPTITGTKKWGEEITISAFSPVGYQFREWTKAGGPGKIVWKDSILPVTTATISGGDLVLEARYDLKKFQISASDKGNGKVSPTGIVNVNYGEDQIFAITPDANFEIADVLVNGVSNGVINKYTFVSVSKAHTIEAQFQRKSFKIAASAGTNGKITPSGTVLVGSGLNQIFTITPNTDYSIADVVVNGSSVGAVGTYEFKNLQSDATIVSSFSQKTYSVTVTSVGPGSVSPSTGNFGAGSSPKFTFTPTSTVCDEVKSVKVGGTSVATASSYTFSSLSKSETLDVTFGKKKYTITGTAQTSGGSVTPSSSNPDACTSPTVNVKAASDYRISQIKLNGSPYTFSENDVTVPLANISSNQVVEASFDRVYSVQVIDGGGGSVSPSSAQSVVAGSSLPISATAKKGFKFMKWEIVSGSPTFVNVNLASTSISNVSSNISVRSVYDFAWENTYMPLPSVLRIGDVKSRSSLKVCSDDVLFGVDPADYGHSYWLNQSQGGYQWKKIDLNMSLKVANIIVETNVDCQGDYAIVGNQSSGLSEVAIINIATNTVVDSINLYRYLSDPIFNGKKWTELQKLVNVTVDKNGVGTAVFVNDLGITRFVTFGLNKPISIQLWSTSATWAQLQALPNGDVVGFVEKRSFYVNGKIVTSGNFSDDPSVVFIDRINSKKLFTWARYNPPYFLPDYQSEPKIDLPNKIPMPSVQHLDRLSISSNDAIWAGDYEGSIYFSTDGGLIWRISSTDVPALSPNGSIAYVVKDGDLQRLEF